MTNTHQIKLQDIYLGAFDMDGDGESISPVFIAVSPERLPMVAENFDEIEPKKRDVPIYEIKAVEFLHKKNNELSGKVSITISAESEIVEDEFLFDEEEFDDSEDYDDDDEYEESGVLESLKQAFLSRASQSSTNLVEPTVKGTEYQNYSFVVDSAYLLTMLSLHFSGEIYIALFDSDHKPSRKTTIIRLDQLQAMVQLPALGSPTSETLLREIAKASSLRGMTTLHKITPVDQEEVERAKRLRGEIFLILSEFVNGSKDSVEQIKNFIPIINDFEKRIILDGGNFKDGDDDTEATITIIDSIISKLSVNSNIPRQMTPQQVVNFRSDFRDFSDLVSELEKDSELKEAIASLDTELGFNDKLSIASEKPNGDAIASYIASPISRGTLPEEIFLLGDDLDFAKIYERNWNRIDSMASFIDPNGEQDGTLGECLIGGLIVSVIRAMRLAQISDAPNNMIFISSLISDVAPMDSYWQLDAFSSRLANGNTELFQKMITSLPKGLEPSQAIFSSLLGITLIAFGKSLAEEEWSDDVVEVALSGFPVIIDFLKDIKVISTEIWKNFNESRGDDAQLSDIELRIVSKQILIHSIQQSVFNLGNKDIDPSNIAHQLIDAMLTIADINTGKKTDSSFNSTEWITTKADYLSNFFQMNSLKFF